MVTRVKPDRRTPRAPASHSHLSHAISGDATRPAPGQSRIAARIINPGDTGRTGYPGGKAGSGVYQTLINLMPRHRVYVEGFIGGGAIMQYKRPAQHNFGLDIDAAVIKNWRKATGDGTLVGMVSDNPACTMHGQEAEFICTDAIRWLEKSRLVGDELVYLDPPYLLETLSSKQPIYKHTLGGNCFTDQQHRRLLTVAKNLPCYVMISGYWSKLYKEELKGWRVVMFEAPTRSGRRATEYVWLNFPAPRSLHDYRFLGHGFRERERIRKKCRRWAANLARMPLLERQAVLSYLHEDDQTFERRTLPEAAMGTERPPCTTCGASVSNYREGSKIISPYSDSAGRCFKCSKGVGSPRQKRR